MYSIPFIWRSTSATSNQMTRPIHGRDPTMTKIWIFWLKSRRITIFEQKVYLNFRPNGIFYFNLKFRYLQKLLFLKKLLFLSKNYFRPKFIILAKISIPKSFFSPKSLCLTNNFSSLIQNLVGDHRMLSYIHCRLRPLDGSS